MRHVRKAYVVYVDLDSLSGIMHTEHSAGVVVRGIIAQNASHYNPNTTLAPQYMQPAKRDGERERRAFIVNINLDPHPGMMHSQESVQHVIRNLLFKRIPHYKPSVSLAPNDFQHTTDTEGSTAA